MIRNATVVIAVLAALATVVGCSAHASPPSDDPVKVHLDTEGELGEKGVYWGCGDILDACTAGANPHNTFCRVWVKYC